jgi:hypothetical protein
MPSLPSLPRDLAGRKLDRMEEVRSKEGQSWGHAPLKLNKDQSDPRPDNITPCSANMTAYIALLPPCRSRMFVSPACCCFLLLLGNNYLVFQAHGSPNRKAKSQKAADFWGLSREATSSRLQLKRSEPG